MYNQKFQSSLKKLTSKLISTLTDFDEGTENHESCMEYSLSNFLHHRFLEADNHKIKRQFKAISEKFFIHSQPEKSKQLQILLKQFLCNDLSQTSFSESQVHYSLLNVVLNLSDNPINAEYSRARRKRDKEAQDDTNWGAYLLEGEDNPKLWGWEESPLTSDDEDLCFDQSHNKNEVELLEEPADPERQQPGTAQKQELDSQVPLVESYWKQTVSDLDRQVAHNKLCSLQSPQGNNQPSTLTEWHILRETLWLLSGRDKLHVYPDEGGKNAPSASLLLSHQSEKSTEENLKLFSDCGNLISKLRSFVFSSKSHESLTYEAFGSALLSYFRWLEMDLMQLEKALVKMEETLLADDLKEKLLKQLSTLTVIGNVYDSSVGCDKSSELTAVHASRLLIVLYEALLDEWNLHIVENDEHINSVDVMLFLWLQTIQPYINIIDSWVSNGELIDPKKEFILQKQKNVPNCQDVAFWNNAVSKVDDGENLSWLHDLLDKISTGGKSMQIVKTLMIRPAKRGPSHEKSREKLYSGFRERFLLMLGNEPEPCVENISPKTKQVRQEGDVLLQTNFKLLCIQNHTNICQPSVTKLVKGASPLPVIIQRTLHPLIESKCDLACKDLLDVFSTHFGLATSLEIFHNFHLMGWGDVMHEFCTNLFHDISTYGGISQDLVGLNIMLHEAVARKSSAPIGVFVTLRSLKSHTPASEGLLGEKVVNKTQPRRHLVSLTDDVHIDYDVQWPVALILSEECIECYQNIFSYLMQIKRAVHSVESLKFETLCERSKTEDKSLQMFSQQKSHRLAILRAKILHLLKHWHSFIMTSVIQAEKETFTEQLHNAQNLDDIINAHTAFLNRVSALCLLERRNQAEKLVHGTLVKIMAQAIGFGMIWERGLENISDKILQKKESDFNECSEFLGRILKTISSRGSMPVLDSLAYSVLPP